MGTSRPVPAEVQPFGSNVYSFATAWDTCVIATGSRVWCWGDNANGELGNGSTSPTSVALPTQVTVPGAAAAVWSGYHQACSLSNLRVLSCWGSHLLGVGAADGSPRAPAAVTALGSTVIAAALGTTADCALKDDGTTWCWGDNSFGQLGSGTRDSGSNSPLHAVQLSANIVELRMGPFTGVARSSDGSISTWGSDVDGQLAGVTEPGPSVVTALGKDNADIEVGDRHACVLKNDGSVWCWGRNVSGQLGLGAGLTDAVIHRAPAVVSGLARSVQAIALGASHSCALTTNGLVWCWGSNASGQLGTSVPVSGVGSGVPVLAELPCP